jgi:hypothetical protein
MVDASILAVSKMGKVFPYRKRSRWHSVDGKDSGLHSTYCGVTGTLLNPPALSSLETMPLNCKKATHVLRYEQSSSNGIVTL